MNQIAAMSKALLKGEVLSVMNCFKWFGITNCAREIGRAIERKFGVEVSKLRKESKTRYGGYCSYFEYRLNRTEYNKPGIEKMENYVREIEQSEFKSIVKRGPKTIHVKANNANIVTETKEKQLDLFSLTPTSTWDDLIN